MFAISPFGTDPVAFPRARSGDLNETTVHTWQVQNARVPIPFLCADNASISVALGSRRRARAPGPPEVHRTLPGLSSSRRRPGGLSSSAARRAMSATGRENLREHLLEQDVEECAT